MSLSNLYHRVICRLFRQDVFRCRPFPPIGRVSDQHDTSVMGLPNSSVTYFIPTRSPSLQRVRYLYHPLFPIFIEVSDRRPRYPIFRRLGRDECFDGWLLGLPTVQAIQVMGRRRHVLNFRPTRPTVIAVCHSVYGVHHFRSQTVLIYLLRSIYQASLLPFLRSIQLRRLFRCHSMGIFITRQ